MIPATNSQLLVGEDWKKIYQSFRSADFKSYDFETLRRTMIQYIQENYPEDFNDFIDSSEYIALIDLIAYLGQNLSFRIDLNARENFLETAERRDSILRLAQLISYNPARNIPAHGFLKVTAVSTTDNVFDSNGTNLANTVIAWNDPTNPDWYQQFVNIMNSTMISNFGNPADKKTIDGIVTEQYKIRSSNADVPLFNFSKTINGTQMSFDIVPSSFAGKDYVYEAAPEPASAFSLIFKNDNQGSGSVNTGFFVHFRQGSLQVARFSIDNPVPNEVVGVNTPQINNTDLWLWQLDNDGNYDKLWTQVPALVGNNVIYNSVNNNVRTLYAVSSREDDQVDLNFADGVFGDLPKGEFRLFYRQSNGLGYVIKPEQMSGVIISVPYTNAVGQPQTLQLTLALQYTVSNSSGPETNASIQLKAPQAYYLQNRMITAEDYNIGPLTAGSDILKVKSVNRISSGLSKYFDISDISGRYSRTNIYGSDGILYKDSKEQNFEFSFTTRSQILSVIKNTLAPLVNGPDIRAFYQENYPRPSIASLSLIWNEVNKTPGQSRGYFSNNFGVYSIGPYSQSNLKYVVPGALVKFVAPTGKYFDTKNALKTIPTSGIPAGGKNYIWSSVVQVIGDGSGSGIGTLEDGTGPVIFSSRVPQGAIPTEVLARYVSILPFAVENEIANICMSQRNFGLTINEATRQWNIILNSNLNIKETFSLTNQANVDDQSLDSSWIFAFIWTGKNYKVRYRLLNYLFESDQETAFFIDGTNINYDFISNTVIKDKIDILSFNTAPGTTASLGFDHTWQIDSAVVEEDGYVEPKKVKVSFYDYNNLGYINDPDLFLNVVGDNFVYFKYDSALQTYSLTEDDITPYLNEDALFDVVNKNNIEDGALFYFYDPAVNVVNYWDKTEATLKYTDQYFGRRGRSDLKFHYVHNSGDEKRIDPSKSNVIDVYVLTNSYDNDVRSWLLGNSSKPLPPTSAGLEQNYSEALNPIKAISDEIVFHPVKYKVLFGSNANINLQATFKAVRNSERTATDNDIKTRVLAAINEFFSLENWDFGQSFYFSELSTYVMNKLTPDITNFVIVPKGNSSFGSFYEVACQSDELFVSGAAISDIEVIESITASQLKSESVIVTSGT